MNEKILTISIAAYNVQKYIKETLDSLVVPEILDDVEVLIVDDGSKDDTYNLAKEYADKYPDTFKVVKKENGGYGSTVNYSINHATGKYFKILDGDDWYEKDGLRNHIFDLKKLDVDVVLTSFYRCYDNKKILDGKYDGFKYDEVIDIRDFDFHNGVQMHSITYKTSVLRESGLRMKELVQYTDNEYATIPFSKVNNLIIKNYVIYNYRLGLAGQSVDKNVSIKNLSVLYDISFELIDYYEKCKKYNVNSIKYLVYRVAATCVDNYRVILSKNISNETLKELKKFDSDVKYKSIDVYECMNNLSRKASKVIKLLRISQYLLYFPIAQVFRSII